MTAARWRTLISAAQLAEHLHAPGWVLVDARFDLAAPEAGRRAYAEGHLPGALYADLDRDLAGPVGPGTGRHPLPDPAAMAARLGAWGLSDGGQLVVYDAGSGAFAARLWWLARWLGHDDVAVLDGGFGAWRAAGLPLAPAAPGPEAGPAAPSDHAAGRFTLRLRPQLAATTAEVQRGLAESAIVLIDVRAAARFRGEIEPIDARAGHVPGARNHPFQDNLAPDGRFLAAPALRDAYARTLAGRSAREAVCMCGSGVTACQGLLALEHAGMPGARLYPGSWSEWIRDPSRPVATSDS